MKTLVPVSMALLAIAVVSTSAAAGAEADTDAAQCHRIVDVSVPYEVHATAEGLRFTGDETPIVVTGEHIQVGEHVFRDPSVRTYYDDLRSFLQNAGSMAKVARPPTRRGALSQAATDMCHAILAMHQSGEAMQQRFQGFTTPVRVKLR